VRIDKFDVDVFLVDPWQLSVKFVSVFQLVDVEFRTKSAGVRAGVATTARAVDVVVVKKTEERCEFARWEQRHM
jgi:hypothetical protein